MMKPNDYICWLLCCPLILLSFSSSAQNFLANNSDGNLIALDINGCTTSTVIGIGSYTDIAQHPNGFLYAVKSNGQLFQINTTTGNTNLVSSFPGSQYYALTADAQGTIFGASGNGSLASYNPNTNTSLTYPNMGFDASGDLTFYQGDMYMATTDNTMVRIDPDNPANNSVFIDFSSSNATIFGIVSAVDGCTVQTYAISNDNSSRIYEIDWENQAFNFVCTVPHQIYGGSSEFEFNASEIFIEVTDVDIQTDCGDSSADVTISANSVNGGLTYSINNQPPQNSGVFDNLPFGDYTVLLTDIGGCTLTTSFTASPANNILIQDVIVDNVSCGETNGSITVVAESQDGGLQFSLDGSTFDSNNQFDDLPPATYMITITDNSGCTTIANATIAEIPPVEIVDVVIGNTTCGQSNGTIQINVNDNGNAAFFSLDNIDFSTGNQFANLAGGNYTLFVKDENDCLVQEDVMVGMSEALILNGIETMPSDCGEVNGMIEVDAEAGNQAILYDLNGSQNASGVFGNLGAGNYEINITTGEDCALGPFPVSITDPCGIYIPNTFTPNEDGYNDIFQLYSPSEIMITDFRVFDRWGSLMFRDGNYSSLEFNRGWNGRVNGKEAPSGVYAYFFNITKNGRAELFKGDLTLVR